MLVLRAVNLLNTSRLVIVKLAREAGEKPLLLENDAVRTWVLEPGCANAECLAMGNVPAAPDAISPVVIDGKVMKQNELLLELPPYSVVIANVTLVDGG